MINRTTLVLIGVLLCLVIFGFIELQNHNTEVRSLQHTLHMLKNEIETLSNNTTPSSSSLDNLELIVKHALPPSAVRTAIKSRRISTLSDREINDISQILNEKYTEEASKEIIGKYFLSKDEFDSLRIMLGEPVKVDDGLLKLTEEQLKMLRGLVIDQNGIGPLKLGMKIEEASVAIGIDITSTPFEYGDYNCHSYALALGEYDWVVRFITKEDKIGKIDIYDPAIEMSNSLSVGKPMKSVLSEFAGQYTIYPDREWPEKQIGIKMANGAVLVFSGPLLEPHDIDNAPYPIDKIKEDIRRISIGIGNVGSIEGCL